MSNDGVSMNNINVKIPDFLSKIISTMVPAIVAECARRFHDLGQCNQPNDISELIKNVSHDLSEECDFDVNEDDSDESLLSSSKYALIKDEKSNHIRNLKIELHSLYQEFMDDIKLELMEYFRDAVKDELRMELFIELEKIKSNMLSHSVPKYSAPVKLATETKFSHGKLTQFAEMPQDINPVNNLNNDLQNSLESNSLFKLVNKNLDRCRNNEPMYTVNELIDNLSERCESTYVEQLRENLNKVKIICDNVKTDQDMEFLNKWDKICRDQHSLNYS